MPRVSSRPTPSALAGVVALAAASAGVSGCAERAAPLLAPRPPRAAGLCDLSRVASCVAPPCDAGAAATCVAPPDPAPPDPPPADTTGPRLRITTAQGPNPARSFTTRRGERTLTLAADVRPAGLAGSVSWTVTDDPSDRVASVAPAAPPNGTPAAVEVPAQPAARWRLPHGTSWADKALAFRVVAEAPSFFGPAPMRDAATVRQREVDVLRQEYVDFGIPVPAPDDVRSPADLVGLTRFAWSELNQGDYGVAVLAPVLLTKLGEMERAAGRALVLNSVFRNPAHHRFHMSVSGGGRAAQLSQHQYGTAVDVATSRDRRTWDNLRAAAKSVGACAEPLNISTVNHVHADWRSGAPQCPKGW